MFHRLRAQVRQLADHFRGDPVGPTSSRPRLVGLERRDMMAALVPGSVLNVWYDGAYGNSPSDVPSATVGVSQINPLTGAEQVLATLAAAGAAGPSATPDGVTAAGGAVFFAQTRAGIVGLGGDTQVQDDRSSIVRVDPATGKAATLATFGRESRGLTAAADGSLVSV